MLSKREEHQYFWHNIGDPEGVMTTQEWWDYLIRNKEIRASYKNQSGDKGERLFRRYKQGDTIVAYSNKYGVVGWGVVEEPESYELLSPKSKANVLNGRMLHRMKVRWKSTKDLSQAIPASTVNQICSGERCYPRHTKEIIEDTLAKQLIEKLGGESGHIEQ